MAITFVLSAGSRSKGMKDFLEKASKADAGVRLAKLGQPFLKN